MILFRRNIESVEQLRSLTRQIADLPGRPLLCVDQEGGPVDRLKDLLGPTISFRRAAEAGQARDAGQLAGEACAQMGFDIDLAPVVDRLLPGASERILAERAASSDPTVIARAANDFLLGLSESGIGGCVKHFPGLGRANLDTHKELPEVDKPWKKLWAEDLLPYRKLAGQFPFAMVAHASYPQVTKDKSPASLSRKWMKDILREKIGYRGLIISDDLEMGGVLAAGSIEHVSVETIRAGADIFLVCHNQELVWRGYEAVLREAEKDRTFAAQVARAASRIMSFKRRTRSLHHFAAPPKAKVVATLKKIVQDFSRVIEEHQA